MVFTCRSGLQETLENIYVEQVVTHILSGKAVNRAIRGHVLVDTALHSLLAENTFGFPLPLEGSPTDSTDEEHNDQRSSQSDS